MSSLAEDPAAGNGPSPNVMADRQAMFDRLRAANATADEPGDAERADTAEPDGAAAESFAEVAYNPTEANVVVRLQHPFSSGDREVNCVRIRPPRYDHVLAVLAGNMRHTEYFAEMTGLTEAEIGALRWPDAAEIIRSCHFLSPDLAGV